MAELPSPGEKKSQEYIAPVATKQYRDVPNPAPTPQPQSRPLSFWGRSKSTKAQYADGNNEEIRKHSLLTRDVGYLSSQQIWSPKALL